MQKSPTHENKSFYYWKWLLRTTSKQKYSSSSFCFPISNTKKADPWIWSLRSTCSPCFLLEILATALSTSPVWQWVHQQLARSAAFLLVQPEEQQCHSNTQQVCQLQKPGRPPRWHLPAPAGTDGDVYQKILTNKIILWHADPPQFQIQKVNWRVRVINSSKGCWISSTYHANININTVLTSHNDYFSEMEHNVKIVINLNMKSISSKMQRSGTFMNQSIICI